MTKEEINEILNQLLAISKSIEETYNNLIKLEINDLKQSEEYQKEIQKLKTSLSLEASLYDKIKDNIELLLYLTEELKKHFTLNNDIIKILIYEDKKYVYRAFEKIRFTLLNHKEIKNSSVFNNEKIEKALIDDIFALFACLLDKNINNPSNKNFKNSLIEMKYKLSYTINSIEEILLNNNFNMPETIYISSDLLESLYKGNEKLRINLASAFTIDAIKFFLSTDNIQYLSSQISYECYLRTLMLRASLQFLPEEDTTNINEIFHEIIDDPSFSYDFYEKSIDYIKASFKSIRKDKSKLVRIHL